MAGPGTELDDDEGGGGRCIVDDPAADGVALWTQGNPGVGGASDPCSPFPDPNAAATLGGGGGSRRGRRMFDYGGDRRDGELCVAETLRTTNNQPCRIYVWIYYEYNVRCIPRSPRQVLMARGCRARKIWLRYTHPRKLRYHS